MNRAEATDYMKYLNNPIVLGLGAISKPAFTKEDELRYLSYINNVSVEHMYSLNSHELQIVEEIRAPNTLSVLSVKNEYLLLAKEKYPQLYERDDGLHYILAFKKFDPLKLETIMTWGDDKLREGSELTQSVLKLTSTYNILNPMKVLNENKEIALGQGGLFKKMFGKTNVSSAKLKITSLKTQLMLLLDECSKLEAQFDKNFEELMFVTSVLTIVNKVNETKEVNDSDKLLFRTLHNRSMTLTDSLTNSQIVKPDIKSLKENIVTVSSLIDDAVHNVFNMIERANNV